MGSSLQDTMGSSLQDTMGSSTISDLSELPGQRQANQINTGPNQIQKLDKWLKLGPFKLVSDMTQVVIDD
jgi:hypothetical protein